MLTPCRDDGANMEHDDHDLNLLAAFAEGRLTSSERGQMLAHLVSCPQCRTVLAALARSADEGSVIAFLARRRHWLTRPPIWLPAAAVFVLATAVVFVGQRPRSENELPAPPQPSVVRQAPQRVPPAGAEPPAQRMIGGKTFRLIASEWIDDAYDPLKALPEVDVRSDAHRAACSRRSRRCAPTRHLACG